MGSSFVDSNSYGMSTKEVQVYEQIKKDLLADKFEPGTVLVERKLTEEYGVSRSPVRYALRQLVKDGLLTGEPGKGIVVPNYTLEDILEVHDLLEVLQVYAIRVSMKNYSIISDAKLEQILEKTRTLTRGDSMEERMEWDIRFHEFIIHSVNNKRLNMIFEILINQKQRFDTASYDDPEHGEKCNQQHEKVFQAIKSRDVEAAVAALVEHETYLKQYYIDKLVIGRYNL